MPRETEHKIEALLRAWAKQRREGIGDDFELHPATRRLLLDEVARTFPKLGRRRIPWGRLFDGLRRRAVGLAGGAVVAVIVLWGVKTFWGNFTNFDVMKIQEANPPQHYKFTFRKPVEDADRLLKAVNQNSNPPPQQLAKAVLPAKTKSLDASAAEQAKASLPPAPPTPSTPLPDPFTLAPRTPAGLKPGAFNPLTAAASATGSVATLTANLATQPSASTTQDKRMETKPAAAGTEMAAVAPRKPASPAAAPEPLGMDRFGAKIPHAAESPKSTPVIAASAAADADGLNAGKISNTKGALAANGIASAKPDNAPEAKTARLAKSPAPAGGLVFVRTDDAPRAAARTTLGLARATQPTALGEASPGRQLAGKTEAAAILSQFELKRDGSKITLIDADGSIYEGAVVAREAESLAPARTALGGADSLASAAGQPNIFAFRASGSSRSLQQTVVITATVANSDAKPPAKSGQEMTRSNLTITPPATTTAPSTSRFSFAVSAPALQAGDESKAAPPVQLLEGTIRVGTGAEQSIKAARSR